MDLDIDISKEIDLLSKDIANEDDLGAVIRGHIRIESLLSRYISAAVIKPEKIEGRRFEYSARVAISLALGLRDGLQGPLTSLGTIRNGFAHTPEKSISEKDFSDFIASFDKKDKQDFESSWKRIEDENEQNAAAPLTHKDRFRVAMVTLWTACRKELISVNKKKVSRHHD